jgi:hypothetical protein
MTFPIFGSECAPGTCYAGPTGEPGTVPSNAAAIDLISLFAFDRLSPDRRLICLWAREIDGELACHWEPDIVLIPQR